MSRHLPALLFALFSTCVFIPVVSPAPVPRSVSTSQQFVVYGPDARFRGALCDLAERTKKTALTLLGEEDKWKTPIVISAQPTAANLPELPPAQLNFGQTGFGPKIQLDLRIGTDVNAPAIERELLRAIFLEMMYRAEPNIAPGTPYVQPPDWLLDGALALGPGRDTSVLSDTLTTAVAANSLIPLPEFLRQRPGLLDSPSRVVYRAYAAALISMLTESPEDRRRLARFVGRLSHAGNDLAVELNATYPALGDSAEKIQRTWTLGVVRFSTTERYRLLGCEETERQLARLLRVELREGDQPLMVYSLEEFPRFLRHPGTGGALLALTQQLLLLSAKANPLYRPVITEYQEIVALLARQKTKRITERLARAREIREHINRRMSAIGDYMNWYEATQSHSESGAFREYMKAAELSAEREFRRHDPISVYLDSLEPQLEN